MLTLLAILLSAICSRPVIVVDWIEPARPGAEILLDGTAYGPMFVATERLGEQTYPVLWHADAKRTVPLDVILGAEFALARVHDVQIEVDRIYIWGVWPDRQIDVRWWRADIPADPNEWLPIGWCDFDFDGDVDQSDFGLLQRALGTTDRRFDLDGDGRVDVLDVDAFRVVMK